MATSTTPQPYTADRPENSTTSVDANVLVRGVGDVGSAVAAVLFHAGYRVALHDEPGPSVPFCSHEATVERNGYAVGGPGVA
jgi:phosphoglycerate dehydrogenase-like enzyme